MIVQHRGVTPKGAFDTDRCPTCPLWAVKSWGESREVGREEPTPLTQNGTLAARRPCLQLGRS